MNSTALAFVGGILCGIFVGAFLLALFIWAVLHLPDDENENHNFFDNRDKL